MKTDIAIVGNGPTARLAFHALKGLGLDVAVVAPPIDRRRDPRTTALMPSSVEALDRLGIDVRPAATPLTDLVIETTGPFGIVRETFAAADAGEPFLAQNLFVTELIDLMPIEGAIESELADLVFHDDRTVAVTTAGDRISARLLIAADGIASIAREKAGIAFHRKALGRHAYCAPVELEHPHRRLCIERYDDQGTITVIPVGEREGSLISIGASADVKRLAALSDLMAGRRLERRQPHYGSIRIAGPKAVFPLSIGWAPQPCRRRVVAVGEAAHIAPPIGAQGWNMAVRDIMVLRDLVRDAVRAGADIGESAALAAYAPRRAPDMAGRLSAVGVLAELATRPIPPLRLARQAGLLALSGLKTAKRRLMRAGLR